MHPRRGIDNRKGFGSVYPYLAAFPVSSLARELPYIWAPLHEIVILPATANEVKRELGESQGKFANIGKPSMLNYDRN